jgi:hypothetical protein
MIARFFILAFLALTAACAPKPVPMDWKSLADYLEEQEKAE